MIVFAAGAADTSVSYFTAVRVLSKPSTPFTLTYTVPPVAFRRSAFLISTSCFSFATVSVANVFPFVAASYTVTISPATKPVTLIVSSAAFLLFATVIVSAAGAVVTGSVAYFTAVRLLSSLFGFVTVTYTVPPVDSNKSFTLIVASFPPSATASDVAFTSPSFATLYTFTMSPSVKSVTLIVSSAPFLLFSTVIAFAAGAADTSVSYFTAVRGLSNSSTFSTLTYTVPVVFAFFAICLIFTIPISNSESPFTIAFPSSFPPLEAS